MVKLILPAGYREPTPEMTKADAEALARAWKEGRIAPEDFDARLRWWKTERAIDEAVAAGYLHRLDVVAERERRQHNRLDTTPPERGWEGESVGDREPEAGASPAEGSSAHLGEGGIPGLEAGDGG